MLIISDFGSLQSLFDVRPRKLNLKKGNKSLEEKNAIQEHRKWQNILNQICPLKKNCIGFEV